MITYAKLGMNNFEYVTKILLLAAVLGQFCDEVISWCIYSYTKFSMKSYEEVSKQILSRSRNHNHFLMIFPGIASEIENVGPIFSSSNPEFCLIKL